MKRFTSVHDVPNINDLVRSAREFKSAPRRSESLGSGLTMGLLFLNPSLRTRMSTHIAARNLGIDVMVLNVGNDTWSIETRDGVVMDGAAGEHMKEAAGVLGRYCDLLGIRTFPGLVDRDLDYAETVLESFITSCNKPVVSLESATRHPLQSLADLVTIDEHKQTPRPKVVLTWAAHPKALPQAVPNSFVEWMRRAPVDLVITHPEGYELAEEFVGDVPVEYNQDVALDGADFVYAKNWSSYRDYGKIVNTDPTWQITRNKMALTAQAKFMHCLPVRRNVIVADDVLDSASSIVLDEAENRIYAAQAVLAAMVQDLRSSS